MARKPLQTTASRLEVLHTVYGGNWHVANKKTKTYESDTGQKLSYRQVLNTVARYQTNGVFSTESEFAKFRKSKNIKMSFDKDGKLQTITITHIDISDKAVKEVDQVVRLIQHKDVKGRMVINYDIYNKKEDTVNKQQTSLRKFDFQDIWADSEDDTENFLFDLFVEAEADIDDIAGASETLYEIEDINLTFYLD